MAMNGKYSGVLPYAFAKLRRLVVRTIIRPMVSWRPMKDPKPGYTVVIGCLSDLAEMLPGNLACLRKQRLENANEILVVIDQPRSKLAFDVEGHLETAMPELPLRFIYFHPVTAWIVRAMRWGWINSWLSWCKGIANSSTRYVMLHDFDAMLVDPNFVDSRYREIEKQGVEFLGIGHCQGNGIVFADEFVKTIELFLDAEFVRRRFRPMDVFNKITMYQGKSVDFDTFLYAQSLDGKRAIVESTLKLMVHPSQMICHFVWFRAGNRRLLLDRTSMILIPYFVSMGDLPDRMAKTTEYLNASNDGRIPFYEGVMDITPLTREKVDWLLKQGRTLDESMFGEVRPEVRAYFGAFEHAWERANGEVSHDSATEKSPALSGGTEPLV